MAHLGEDREATRSSATRTRARFDYVVRVSGAGFWYCDLPFDVMDWDERVREHFFFPADARITMADFYARLHPDDREPTRQAIEASISGRGSYDVEYRTVDPRTGATKWIRALGGAAYAEDGTPTHFDGVTVDVTAQKLDQHRLASLNEQLREQDRRKDEFLATLAHELRNPLAPIRTGLHLLGLQTSPDQTAKLREMMERQLAHLVRMVDDLLDISRVTLGKVSLKKELTDFRPILNSALETTRDVIEAGGHELTVVLPPDPLPLNVDPTRLTQVIANLLNNSAKYTPAGGRIELSAARESEMLVLRVTDTGVGIPAAMLPRVFDLFTQVDPSPSSAQSGLGLGLTLVRRIVEMHGGSVEAESPGRDQGSTFTVRLPIARPVEVASTARPASRPAVATEALRILVVDDNVDAADSLAMLLKLRGHETHLAHTGESAVTDARVFRPHVAFVDIGLPDLSGYEVARRIRAESTDGPPLRLVALTGWGSAEDRRRAKAAGFDNHCVKPVDLDNLSEILTRLTQAT